MAREDAWRETCQITIAKQGAADVKFETLTETVDIDYPDKDIEGIKLVNGGRLKKYTPQGDCEVTLEAYASDVGEMAGGTMAYGFHDLMSAAAGTTTGGTLVVVNDRTHSNYRITILWTDQTVDNATSEVPTGNCRRFVAADAEVISIKDSFTDDILKSTVKLKCTAFDKNAAGNMKWESMSNSAGTLTALGSYTTSAKW